MSSTFIAPLLSPLTSFRFFSHFNNYIYALVNTRDALAFAIPALLSEFASDGVTYLELRTTPRALSDLSAEETVELVHDEIRRWNDENAMVVRLILSIDQAKHDREDADWVVDTALRLRNAAFPPIVVGVDVCGDPNHAKDLKALDPVFERCQREKLPAVVHFGEIPRQAADGTLEVMLRWNPKRVGHAIHLPDSVRDELVRRDIAPELCLSCNVLANMLPAKDNGEKASHGDHHFGWWWKNGGSISLGTDDVGVFGAKSSDEHLHAAEHFGLSKEQLVELSRRAIQGALDRDAIPRVERELDSFAVLEKL